MKIILFPEITVFKNKWLLNSSKNIIKELVSRKRLLLFIRLQDHGGFSQNLKLFYLNSYFSDYTVGKEKSKSLSTCLVPSS